MKRDTYLKIRAVVHAIKNPFPSWGVLIPSVDRIKFILHNLIISKSHGHSMKIVLDGKIVKNPLYSVRKVTVREMIHSLPLQSNYI